MTNLRKITCSFFFFWIFVQILLIVFNWNMISESDYRAYQILAEKCVNANSLYPMNENLYDNFIWAPGFVNSLIIQLKLLGSFKGNMFLNLFYNIGIVSMIFFIAKKYCSEKTALISVILFCSLYSNYLLVLPTATELPFLFYSLLGLCLSIKGGRFYYFAGLSFVVAETIRPITIIFLMSALILMFLKKADKISYVRLLLSILVTASFFGGLTYMRTGFFNYKSTTGGYNLIMVANDHASMDGGFNGDIFYDSSSTAFIPGFQNITTLSYTDESRKMTFMERDKKWKNESVKWIVDNPMRYLKSYFVRFFHLYDKDLVFDVYKFDSSMVNNFMKIVKCLTYYFILFWAVVGFFKIRNKNFYALLSISVMGTLATCLFPVSDRYHYPMMFPLILFAAAAIEKFLENRKGLC